MRILLTNDDGIDSPLLQLFLDALNKEPWVDDVFCIVPDIEKSWIGSAISKHTPLHLLEHSVLEGHTVHTVTGTPSDCVTLAIGNLLESPPDLIVSGINFGMNAGICFFYGSGTLAAARQAAMMGVPGIACSAALNQHESFSLWSKKDLTALWKHKEYLLGHVKENLHMLKQCIKADIFRLNSPTLTEGIRLDHLVDYVSINTPTNPIGAKPRLSNLQNNRYIPFFEAETSQYKTDLNLTVSDQKTFIHRFKGFTKNDPPLHQKSLPLDIDCIKAGEISVTCFSLLEGDCSEEVSESSILKKLCARKGLE